MSAAPKIKYPDLPVAKRRDEIMAAMRKHQVVIVVGETGSGKTTQLPKMAYELAVEEGKDGRVGCTQPRRLAAATVAKRVAEEMGTALGDRVGYQVRFVEKVQGETSIKFMTDGILLAETQRDRDLRQYDTLIIDEAHERSLNIDFVLGYLKNLLKRRKDLRIVVSSATMDSGKFSEYFNDAPIVNVEGRTFPVEDFYLPPHSDGEDLARHVARGVEWVTDMDATGDVLIFLPGEREIRECADTLEGKNFPRTEILPLFARLGLDEQQRVFSTGGANRRVVLATNVAETSVTIPGIVYVIDSGQARVSRWNPARQIQRLQIEQISQASARQRRGRCGRVQEGVCVRLYDEEVHDAADEYTDPEIRRSSLAGVILRMKSLKLPDVREFPFLSPPSAKAISEGHRTLEEVGAIEKDGYLTRIGHQLARLPLDPRLGRMLIEAKERKVLDAVLVMVGGMSVMDVRERPQEKQAEADKAHVKFNDEESDFLTLLHIWSAVNTFREKRRFKRNQLRKFCKQNFISFRRVMEWDQVVNELGRLVRDTLKVKTSPLASERSQWGDEAEMHKSLLAGIPKQFGFWDKEKRIYRSTGGREFSVFPGSGLFGKKRHEWLIAYELVETSRVFARKVALLDVRWVEEVVPHLCRHRYHSPTWNEKQGAVYGKETVICGGLTLVDGRQVFYGRVNPKEAHEVFIREAVLESGLRTKGKFMHRLAEVKAEVEDAEHKLRRRGGLWSDEAVYDFFLERIPTNICTAKAFQKWRTTGNNEDQLMITVEDCIWGEIEDLNAFPDLVWHGETGYHVSYNDTPGEREDGMVFELGLGDVAEFPDFLPSWVVPGLLEERVYLLIRSLPKSQRQACSPARDVTTAFLEEWHGWVPARDLLTELAAFLSKRTGHVIDAAMFDESRLPDGYRAKIRIWSDDDEELAFGTDINELRQKLTGLMRERLELHVNQEWEMTGGEGWDFGEIPRVTDDGVFPALVDEGDTVGMRAYLNETEAAESHRAGCVRLFQIVEPKQTDYVRRKFPLGMMAKVMLPMMDAGDGQLIIDLLRVSCEGAMGKSLPRNAEQFAAAIDHGRGELFACADRVCRGFEEMLESYRVISDWIEDNASDRHLNLIARDLAEEIEWLLGSGFAWRAGYDRLRDYGRYFQAMEERLKRLESLPLVKDDEKRERVCRLWDDWFVIWKKSPDNVNLWPIGWQLMEWRVAEFAPSLPRKIKVSEKKIETAMASLMA
ncbi:ATP-dependent RNA helicase HrpA [Verrucomicrobiaceae bacterium 5K15]|uniref:ATP-dependent RNA helicase HrpA n=1 Tax=Oceaniferula flava TaxID=2800421 RepID=A0AAE2SAX6_9BACT|nr:ATP-dependent RNA helicase HrpA [Oceaniferula flavus]MBK1854077.1 ATP-dependent RNA helicase HrpA [Oceaniferula flavus]MBM1135383.1 ATP-dependent RNA helicase HrpA [Oceaniferula flavus]